MMTLKKQLSYECGNYNHVDCKGHLARSCSCWCHKTSDNPRYENVIPSKKARVKANGD